MKLIIGLGNPGEQFKKTRHNLGFAAIDALAKKLNAGEWQFKKQFNALVAEIKPNGKKIILAKPQTFMNESGRAVKSLAEYFHIAIKNILIIHDEMDLPLGEFRFQTGRGAAGHKGVQSIIDELKSKDFSRLRIGIGIQMKEIETEDFVLQKFSEAEEKIALAAIEEAAEEIIKGF